MRTGAGGQTLCACDNLQWAGWNGICETHGSMVVYPCFWKVWYSKMLIFTWCLHAPLQAFGVFQKHGIKVTMISQGASKTNISMVIDGSRGQDAVKALHHEFFEMPVSENCVSPYQKGSQ